MREYVSLVSGWSNGNRESRIRNGESVFVRSFQLYRKWNGCRVTLIFSALKENVCLTLNGCPVPLVGDRVKKEAELSDYVDYEKPNRLELSVTSSNSCLETDLTDAPLAKSDLPFSDAILCIRCRISIQGTIFVSSKSGKDDVRTLTAQTTLQNEDAVPRQVRVTHTLFTYDGKKIKKTDGAVSIPPFSQTVQTLSMPVYHPLPWLTDAPTLYRLKTELTEKNEPIDEVETVVGFRDVRADNRRGFLLENASLKLKTVYYPTDYSANLPSPFLFELGFSAVRDIGANACFLKEGNDTEALLTFFDEKGMTAILDLSSSSDPEVTMSRYRTHPSLVMWSLEADSKTEQDSRGFRILQRKLTQYKRFDTTRPFLLFVGPCVRAELSETADLLCVKTSALFSSNSSKASADRADHSASRLETNLSQAENITNRLENNQSQAQVNSNRSQFLFASPEQMEAAWQRVESRGSYAGLLLMLPEIPFIPSLACIADFPFLTLRFSDETLFEKLQACWEEKKAVLSLTVRKAESLQNTAEASQSKNCFYHSACDYDNADDETKDIDKNIEKYTVEIRSNCPKISLSVNGRPIPSGIRLSDRCTRFENLTDIAYLDAVGFWKGKEAIRKYYEISDGDYALNIKPTFIKRPFSVGEIAFYRLSLSDKEGREAPGFSIPVIISAQGGIRLLTEKPVTELKVFPSSHPFVFAVIRENTAQEMYLTAEAEGILPARYRVR